MFQQRVNLGLQVIFLGIGLTILHLVGSVFGGLGVLTDGFITIGLVQSIKFLINAEFRKEAYEGFEEFIDINEISESTSEYLEEVLESTIPSTKE